VKLLGNYTDEEIGNFSVVIQEIIEDILRDLGIIDIDDITTSAAALDTITYNFDEGTNTITYKLKVIAADQNEVDYITQTIEGDAFKQQLVEDIEADINNIEIDEITTEAAAVDDDDDDDKVDWFDYRTYELLNWIIFGAACCILCIFFLCFMRCCFLCCKKRGRGRSKSGYRVGQAMFDQIENDADADSAFQSDLKSALEMQSRGKLLRNSTKDLDLDADDIGIAFDMDVETKPINKKKDKNEAGSNDDKTKKMSEGVAKPQTGDTLIPNAKTPGGPEPDDDDENVPKAPDAPKVDVQDVDDYDLL